MKRGRDDTPEHGSSSPVAGARNTLTVLVDYIAIEDGQIDPPEVGAVVSFPLRFDESPASEPDSVTVRGDVEPSPCLPSRDSNGLKWSGLLRGDGWSATWSGRQPRVGRVEVTGQFMGVMGIDAAGHARGRVKNLQVVSMFWERVDTRERWRPVVGRREYHSRTRSPRSFTDERRATDPPTVSRNEIGVLIDLDLDDVPELPLRRPLVADGVSSSGSDVWVLDRVLPQVIRFGESGTRRTYLLPAAVAAGRRVWSTPAGCWVSGPDGTFRVDSETGIAGAVSTVSTSAGAVVGEYFLACTTAGPWQIHAPDDEVIAVDAPEGSAIAAVADGSAFVVLLRVTVSGATRYRLVRVATTGAIDVGPVLSMRHETLGLDPDLLPAPLTLAYDDAFAAATAELEVGNVDRVPRSSFRSGVVGPYLWMIGHPPDRTSRSWWPLQGAVTYDYSRGQFWLLTILDRTTLAPVHTAVVRSPRPSLTQDSAGIIWLTAGGELQRITSLGGTMQWSESVPY